MVHAECEPSYWLNSLAKIMLLTVDAKPHRSNPDTSQEENVCKLVRSTKMSLLANIFILRHQPSTKQNFKDKLVCWLGKSAYIQFMNSWCEKMDEVMERFPGWKKWQRAWEFMTLQVLLKTYIRGVKMWNPNLHIHCTS